MDIKKIVYKKLQSLTKQDFDNTSDIYNIGIDSLDLVELVTDAEDELGVQITDEQLEQIKKVEDIVKALEEAAK